MISRRRARRQAVLRLAFSSGNDDQRARAMTAILLRRRGSFGDADT